MPVDYEAVCKALKGFCTGEVLSGEVLSCGACAHIAVPIGTGVCADCGAYTTTHNWPLFHLADTRELLHRRHAENLPKSYYPYANSTRRLSENAFFVLLTLSTTAPTG